MTLDEVKNIRKEMQPEHDILTDDICWAIDWLLDALRLAESQAADVREAAAGTAERYGYAMRGSAVSVEASQTIADAIRALPLPAPVAPARTYEDGVREAAKAIRDHARRTFGKTTTVANDYAGIIEALLAPAPATTGPRCVACGGSGGGGLNGLCADCRDQESAFDARTTPAPTKFDAEADLLCVTCRKRRAKHDDYEVPMGPHFRCCGSPRCCIGTEAGWQTTTALAAGRGAK